MRTEHEYDSYLLEKIQPQGGISFSDSRYISTGGGYEACLHIYEYPKSIDDYWMARLCNINNTVTIVDISTDDIDVVKKNINKSMQEQDYRYQDAKKYNEKYDAQKRYAEMQHLYDEVDSLGEVVKLVHIRIFLFDTSWTELEQKVKNIKLQLAKNGGYLGTIYMNETKDEWKSMYMPYQKQAEQRFFVYGQPLTTSAIASGNPFHYSCLEDENGIFLGKTPCGGNVLFDLFTKSEEENRLSYNFLCVGTQRRGKSTLLKKQFKHAAIMGDYVRAFDISGEFTFLTNALGGRVISSAEVLNPLEILRSGDTDIISFSRHISKVITIYKFLIGGDCDRQELIDFEKLLGEFYRTLGFEIVNGKPKRQFTGLAATEYPVFSDMLQFIKDKISDIKQGTYDEVEMELVKANLIRIDNVRKVIENIVKNWGYIFDRHTTIENISDEQIITFDISDLKEMKPEIFDAQIFNLFSLSWDNCVSNGKIMMKGMYEGTIAPEDIIHTVLLLDESFRWINAKKLYALELVSMFMREAPKYFGSLGLVAHSIRDFVPEQADTRAIDQLKIIFELTQYKFIYHQDSNVTSLLNKVFEEVLTPSQIARIPKLGVGETILSITGDRNIEFKIHLPEDEKALFRGGL